MSAETIRIPPEETHRALQVRAARNGRSTEAEIRDIIEAAVRPTSRIKLGSLLGEIGRRAGLRDEDLVFSRDRFPATPVDVV
jgi:plasmid stability protein